VGAVGFWDIVAFDEVGNMKIKDTDTIQIMKDYMANGRFSRGREIIANASFAFVGNIDYSIQQLVDSYENDLFITLPKAFDLAIQDRFFFFLPGWEIPKMDNKFFTQSFGLITDYMAEAFHYMFKHNSDFIEIVNRKLKLGSNIQGRDEIAIKKTVTALLKILYPGVEPTDEEFNMIVEYAVEGRRRVKEQMNKRKPDDEFALIDLSYYNQSGSEIIVYCPESKNANATQNPRNDLSKNITPIEEVKQVENAVETTILSCVEIPDNSTNLIEKRIKVLYGDTGYGYESLFGAYLVGVKIVTIEDPYIRKNHQISNFLRFCELLVKVSDCLVINLTTGYDDIDQKAEIEDSFAQIADNLFEYGITFNYEFSNTLHDREIKLSNGWAIKMGRGLDYFQSLSGNYLQIGVNDMDLRPCLETSFDFYKL